MKLNIRLISALAFSTFLFASCSTTEKTAGTGALPMDSVAKNFYEDYLRLNPLDATTYGDYRYNDKLPNTLTASYREEVRNLYTSYRNHLKSMNYDSLSAVDQMSYDVLMWECESKLEGLNFSSHLMPVNHFSSFNLYFTELAGGTSAVPFKTVKHYDDWLSRVDQYIAWCDTAIANMSQGIKTGYVLPKVIVEKAIPQWTSMTKGQAEDHIFFSPAKNFPPEFSAEDTSRLSTAFKDMVEQKLIPAYQRMGDFLTKVYLPAAVSSTGIDKIPNGKEYYDYKVKEHTTTEITADSVFALGMSEVKRIMKETEAVKNSLNFRGDLQSFFNELRLKKELTPFETADQVIANFNAIHERMKPNLAKLFKNTPRSSFEIRRTPAFREAVSAHEYLIGSEDGSRPGIFYVPVPDPKQYNIMRDEDIFLHEAIPGHHYQMSLQMENQAIPAFRRITGFGAYAEGWALYTESLGKELGLYTDPYQYLGMLGGEMHRAIRLVVDAGMHSKGWTREQAIEFSKQHEALPEQVIIAEVERYMVIPGQALSYKIGQLKIRELRNRAERELGATFNIAEFHDEILNAGSLPLMVLEKKIDRWIKARKTSG
jgi:uncharacterized protein (DUF885 family)